MVSTRPDGSYNSRMEEYPVPECRVPLLLVEAKSGLLLKANQAFRQAFHTILQDPSSSGPKNLDCPVLPFHQEMISILAKLSDGRPFYFAAGAIENAGNAYDALATFMEGNDDCAWVMLCRRSSKGGLEDLEPRGDNQSQSATLDALNKQLHFERLIRQIITKVYSSLDKDTILQGLVDSLGRALKCQRCLIVIESPSALPVVTHEYAEADISPLGLGRTAKFPVSVFERLRDGVVAVPDVTNLRTVDGVMLEDVNDLLDNSVSSMVGAPIVQRGVVYGVIAAMQLGSIRKWDGQELDLIQVCAHHASISLEHCQSQQRMRDQLFNVNVWSSLTQQLTSTLELASGSSKPTQERPVNKSESVEVPPLSSRELEVLKLIATGLANKEIANQLFLTESTVELHASRIRKKLKLRSRTALVKYACDHNIV